MKFLILFSAVFLIFAGCSSINGMPSHNLYEAPYEAIDSSSVAAAVLSNVAEASPASATSKGFKRHDKHTATGHITLSWNPVTGAKWYNLYYGTKPGVTRKSPKKIKRITTTSHTVTGLSPDTTYFFVVTAANPKTESPESSEISGKPKKQH